MQCLFFSFQYEGSRNEVLVFVSNVKTQVLKNCTVTLLLFSVIFRKCIFSRKEGKKPFFSHLRSDACQCYGLMEKYIYRYINAYEEMFERNSFTTFYISDMRSFVFPALTNK